MQKKPYPQHTKHLAFNTFIVTIQSASKHDFLYNGLFTIYEKYG